YCFSAKAPIKTNPTAIEDHRKYGLKQCTLDKSHWVKITSLALSAMPQTNNTRSRISWNSESGIKTVWSDPWIEPTMLQVSGRGLYSSKLRKTGTMITMETTNLSCLADPY
ncbi:unnamed protein product, partial [Acanthoscelides obtectus]